MSGVPTAGRDMSTPTSLLALDGRTEEQKLEPPQHLRRTRGAGRAQRCDHMGDGLIMIHTLDGGPRSLRVPGGKTISITLAGRSTTVLDAQTGAVLLA